MRKFLLKILTGVLALSLLVTGLIACSSSAVNWEKPTLTTWGNGSVYGGFIGETDNYIYFINGMATNTDDNTFGAPVKGALMVQDKSNLDKEPQVVVPKLFASTDYNAGVYIYDGRAYYGTPNTDKDSSGGVANYEMAFASTKLDGTDTVSYFTVGALSTQFRILECDGVVYIIYYDSVNYALCSYNTATRENTEIVKTDETAEGKEAISLSNYKFLDKDAVKGNCVVAYSITIYDEEYHEEAASEENYERIKKEYNQIFVYGVFDGELKSELVLDGSVNKEEYSFHYIKGLDLYLTSARKGFSTKNLVYNIKNATIAKVENMDIVSKDSLILDEGWVITLSEGVVKMRNSLRVDNAEQEIIAINSNISSLLNYDEESGYLYYFNKSNTLCRIEIRNEEAVEVAVSEDMVSLAWYYPEFMEIGGKKHVFYLDSSTKGASYVKCVNLEVEDLGKDTDDDGENDKFYIEGHKFLAQRLDVDKAAYVSSVINDIASDINSDGSLKFVEKDGAFTVESVIKAKELLDEQSPTVYELVDDGAKETLNNYLSAIDWANKYDTLKAVKNLSMLDENERDELYQAYLAVKGEIEQFTKSDNYTTIRALLGNELNAHYQKAVKEFEPDEE